MHLAITKSVAAHAAVGSDKARLLLGSILPDALGKASHRRRGLSGGAKRTYDLTGFRAEYGELLRRDPLYKGFYLHLLQDLLFRRYVYGEHGWNPRPEGNLARLHNDYALLNRPIAARYHLSVDMVEICDIAGEPLLRGYEFDPEQLSRELRADFERVPEGNTFFFSEEMACEYIEAAVRTSARELDAIAAGAGFTDEIALAYAVQ